MESEKVITKIEKKLKVLITEDDVISSMFITILLKNISKEVLKAKTGGNAVEICQNNPDIDLILMDIGLPDIDGYEATRQIRKFNKEVVIIAQTGYNFDSDREKAISAGCNEYMTKPIEEFTLMQLLKIHFNI